MVAAFLKSRFNEEYLWIDLLQEIIDGMNRAKYRVQIQTVESNFHPVLFVRLFKFLFLVVEVQPVDKVLKRNVLPDPLGIINQISHHVSRSLVRRCSSDESESILEGKKKGTY